MEVRSLRDNLTTVADWDNVYADVGSISEL